MLTPRAHELFIYFMRFYVFLFYVSECLLACTSVYHMHAVPKGAIRGLELQMVVLCHVGAGN